jgi:hypothetical protein
MVWGATIVDAFAKTERIWSDHDVASSGESRPKVVSILRGHRRNFVVVGTPLMTAAGHEFLAKHVPVTMQAGDTGDECGWNWIGHEYVRGAGSVEYSLISHVMAGEAFTRRRRCDDPLDSWGVIF